jgi:hypothetical protein
VISGPAGEETREFLLKHHLEEFEAAARGDFEMLRDAPVKLEVGYSNLTNPGHRCSIAKTEAWLDKAADGVDILNKHRVEQLKELCEEKGLGEKMVDMLTEKSNAGQRKQLSKKDLIKLLRENGYVPAEEVLNY